MNNFTPREIATYLHKIYLLATIILATFEVASSQSVAQTTIVGRIVDSDGRPVSHAAVYLEPEKWRGGFDRFIESGVTSDDGVFQLMRPAPRGNRKTLWRLFVTVDETGQEYTNPVDPPFDLLRLKNRSFSGRRIVLDNTKILNLGDVRVQFFYGSVELDISFLRTTITLKDFPWKNASIRICDDYGNLASLISLSRNDLEKSIKNSGEILLISLPEGRWNVDLIIDKKVVGRARQLNVSRKASKHILMDNRATEICR